MTDCVKIEQSPGCYTKANGATEQVMVVREYGIGASGQAVLIRTHFTDVNGDHITPGAGEFVRLGACLQCCGDVVISDTLPPGHKIATITLANGQTVDLNESVTTFSSLYNATNGVKIGEYTDEEGTAIEVFGPKQSVDVNLTAITYVPAATGNADNRGQVVVDPNGTIWIIDQEGDAQQMQMPAFKERNRFYADPAGNDGTGTGANEKPFATAQAAVNATTQAGTTVLNEGTYGGVTMATQNTTLSGASNGYSGLVRIASLTATATGTSVRAEGLTVTGNVSHTGAAPLYLNNVTVNGDYESSSTAYTEIKDSRIQDGTISKTAAGILFIRDSQIGNATFSTPNSIISLRSVNIDAGDRVTIGAGVIYSLQHVVGEVVRDPAAVSIEQAVLAQGGTADQAEGAVTSHFMKLRMHTPDFEASPTKVVTWDEATGELEYSDFPVTTPTTTSLTPVVYDGGWVGAQADDAGNLAKAIELSDATIVSTGLVTWTGHGLTIGETYYTSQSTAGAYVTPEPTSGLSQKLFTVIDANTIDLQVQEGVEIINDSATAPAEFAQTVYFNSTAPSTATIFDLENPPATNDDALKADSSNLYIGTDGSTWTYNSSTSSYSTYVYPVGTPLVLVAQTNNQTNTTSINVRSNYSFTIQNTFGASWNATTGVLTAPKTGFYDIEAQAEKGDSWNVLELLNIWIAVNGAINTTRVHQATAPVAGTQHVRSRIRTILYLTAGQTIDIRVNAQGSGTLTTPSRQFQNYLNVYFLGPN